MSLASGLKMMVVEILKLGEFLLMHDYQYSLTAHRETIKRVLALPQDTQIVWKSHDDSIAQRSAIDQARQEKAGHHSTEKRRTVSNAEESTPSKDKTTTSS